VTNLVENGVRHGSGTVRVSVTAEESGVRIRVDDEGEGISPEMRRRVFTKFWTGGGRGGSGLGLYLVNGLVRAHGGTVTIGDAEGGGARIDVVLPATVDDPDV
jgi:signal transduction histidine kinase